MALDEEKRILLTRAGVGERLLDYLGDRDSTGISPPSPELVERTMAYISQGVARERRASSEPIASRMVRVQRSYRFYRPVLVVVALSTLVVALAWTMFDRRNVLETAEQLALLRIAEVQLNNPEAWTVVTTPSFSVVSTGLDRDPVTKNVSCNDKVSLSQFVKVQTERTKPAWDSDKGVIIATPGCGNLVGVHRGASALLFSID